MKHLYLFLTLLLPLNFVVAQNVTVGTISKSTLCTGDTVWVPYSSSGSFAADNFFDVQLSDGNGSFSTFTNIGHDVISNDSIPVIIGYGGDHFRFRVIGTDPYTISNNASSDIRVVNYPIPNPSPNTEELYFGAAGFAGDPILFKDENSEPDGSTYLWKYDQDANTLWSTTASPSVTFSSDGIKTGTLTVTNSAGCATSKPFQLRILSCNPIIPDSAHIVTGTESGNFAYVWVKAGGNYTAIEGRDINSTVYVEPGGALRPEFRSIGLYYVKSGASFISSNGQGYATVVMSRGNSITWNSYNDVDTLYCDNLQFDYSKVNPNSSVEVTENPLQIQNSPNTLQVSCDGEDISVSIVNLFGTKILSKTDRDILSLDLSSLANGVYFAIITSGNRREVRKIAVVH